MNWFRANLWVVTVLTASFGLCAYCFTTFASVKYVDAQDQGLDARQNRTVNFIKENQLKNDRQFERVNDKLDLILLRSSK